MNYNCNTWMKLEVVAMAMALNGQNVDIEHDFINKNFVSSWATGQEDLHSEYYVWFSYLLLTRIHVFTFTILEKLKGHIIKV